MKKAYKYLKRIFAIILAMILAVETFSAAGVAGVKAMIVQAAENADGYQIDNGYIKVTLSDKNGGFGIRTLEGDKVNKDDDNKYLLFEYDDDNTSFTSFQVTREGETKEYIFGGKYAGSSKVKVSKEDETLVAVWSVDDLTFTQKIALEDTGSNEHGTANISYTVENTGAPAQVKCRILMDTALGYQDYAHYSLGDTGVYTERETTIDAEDYNKVFYAVDDPDYPSITAYTINASINNEECKPYAVTFAHWNNLAATVFDYEANEDLTFVNPYNLEYLTADSAYALYYDMGSVSEGGSAIIGTNYGIFSNETVSTEATTAINVVAPDVLDYAKDENGNEVQNAYENEGIFTVKTYVENFSDVNYDKVRIVVYATGGIDSLTQSKEPANATYNDPYYVDIKDFNAGEKQDIDWYFAAEPQESGQYAKVHYKMYNVSDDATMSTGAIMTENLIGEGYSYILCPGSVDKIPQVKFTGTSPETIYTEGIRNLYLTGENFSLLLDTGAYQVLLRRVDGEPINGQNYFVIPDEQIKIDDYKNTITLTMTDDNPGKLPEGTYQLVIDYTDESAEDLTGPGLRFQVIDDVLYKNDAYGFLAVIKDTESDSRGEILYKIEHFESEEAYQEEIAMGRLERDDVLVELRGVFIKEDEDPDDDIVAYEGISLDDDDNVMVLNDCLDIKNGAVTVTENDGSVTVDFEADIYTTGAGTFVWSGVAALTELERGMDFGLIPYDENGNREDFDFEVIGLMWPSVGEAFQNLMGLLFNLKYGELGVIEHSEDAASDTRIVAFGASMDLSFIIPDANPSYSGRTRDYLGDAYDCADHSLKFSPEEVRAMAKNAGGHSVGTADTEATSWKDRFTETGTSMDDEASGGDGDSKSACILIDDVLFGGEYLGVNMSIALGIPAYIDGMPALESLLTIRTVGDWFFGVSGVCNFEMFYLEGSIQIMSYDGYPVPDSINFFLGGVEPGINLDGCGVLWLQGAGGGIENLYDTIFLSDSIPPLKLILEAQFSLMQVISARATLGLSLQGVDVTLSNGKLANSILVLNYATVDLDWYPEFYFMGGAQLSIFDAISGTGYIVVEEDGFFEFFVRASLQIPGSIMIIGGTQIAGVNMGVNMDKVWGQVEAMDVGLGVTYYWGSDDVDWNSGSKVYPTYPELAGMEGRSAMVAEVGYDEESGETLYAVIGTNLNASATTMSLRSNAAVIDETIGDVLKTNDISLSTEHTMTLSDNGHSKMLVIEWEAESKEQAYLDVVGDDATENPGISIVNVNAAEGQAPFYDIKLIDQTLDLADEANEGTNANLTYDEETKKACLAVTFTTEDAFGPSWTIYTPEGAALVLYDVAPLPALEQPAAEDVVVDDNGQMTVKVTGSELDSFTNLSFVAENEDGESVMLYALEGDNIAAQLEGGVTFDMPESLSSGTYTLHITAWDDNAMFYSSVDTTFTYVNKNQPNAPVIESVEGSGDYKVIVTLDTEDTEDFAGYAISAYDKDGNPVNGVSDMLYYKDGTSVEYNDDGTIAVPENSDLAAEIEIGGHYEYPYTDSETGEETTLIVGFSEGEYTVSVKKWKLVNDGAALLYSDGTEQTVTIKAPVETEVTVTPSLPDGAKSEIVKIVQKEATETEEEMSYEQVVYNSSDINLILSSSTQSFTGRWEIDGGTEEGTSGTIDSLTNQVQLSFEGLSDGTHTLEFFGENLYGDATSVKYTFGVDTQGPRLLVSEPLNGSFFDYWTGALTVSGITDKETKLTITDETTGKVVYTADVVDTDDFGRFEEEITLDCTILEHTLTLKAEDSLGNTSEKQVTVTSDGLGSIEKLMLYADGEDATNEKLSAGTTHALTLVAKLKRPADADETEEDLYMELNQVGLVDWQQVVVNGEATFAETPSTMNHTSADDAEGMITAAFLVSSAGAYTVCASFGDTGETVKDLSDADIKMGTAEVLYTGAEVTPIVEVWYQDEKLTDGKDYQITYMNNIEVSEGASDKPTVIVTGIGNYTGTLSEEFEIQYLDLGDGWYTISGTEGKRSYYISDVTVMAEEGYEIIYDLDSMTAGDFIISAEQKNEITFHIRRISDGAITDVVTETVKVDKTGPTGAITMKDKIWDTFLTVITFGIYQSDNYKVTIKAEDNYSGVDKIQYIISDTAFGSVEELEASNPEWKNYNSLVKPTIDDDGTYVVYVKMTDEAGNVSYISSEGIQIEGTPEEEATTEGTTEEEATTEEEIKTEESDTGDHSLVMIYAAVMLAALCGAVVILQSKKRKR